jgi:hypothetical protein
MQDSSKSVARALGAVDDAAELLGLAERAVDRARTDCSGEALGVAERLRQQIQFLRKVTGLLRHEIKRAEGEPRELGSSEPARIDDRSSVFGSNSR